MDVWKERQTVLNISFLDSANRSETYWFSHVYAYNYGFLLCDTVYYGNILNRHHKNDIKSQKT
jgi:hypothetical protein